VAVPAPPPELLKQRRQAQAKAPAAPEAPTEPFSWAAGPLPYDTMHLQQGVTYEQMWGPPGVPADAFFGPAMLDRHVDDRADARMRAQRRGTLAWSRFRSRIGRALDLLGLHEAYVALSQKVQLFKSAGIRSSSKGGARAGAAAGYATRLMTKAASALVDKEKLTEEERENTLTLGLELERLLTKLIGFDPEEHRRVTPADCRRLVDLLFEMAGQSGGDDEPAKEAMSTAIADILNSEHPDVAAQQLDGLIEAAAILSRK
jgi:hypothetical protein